jgi:hypothetical protein
MISGELFVGLAREQQATEGRERGEAHGGEDAVGVHVPDALVDVVAAGAELVEGGGLHAVLLRRPAHDGVEADVGNGSALEDPDVAAVLLPHDARRTVLVARGDVVLEHRRGLDDVVVDRHQDHIFGAHRYPPREE